MDDRVKDQSDETDEWLDALDSVASEAASVRWKLYTLERRADDIVWLRYCKSS